MKNKKILLIAKETYSWPMILLAEKLKDNNDVGLFFICPSECTFNEFELGYSSTYYYAKKNLPDVKQYDVRAISLEFVKNAKTPPVDYDYISMLEKEYTHYKNINLQCMSAQELSRSFHFRSIYGHATHDQRFYWVELNYKQIIKVIDDFQPDMVLDLNNEMIQRTILSEVCYKKNIPHINVEESKIEDNYHYSFSNTAELDEYFLEDYQRSMNLTVSELAQEYHYIRDFQNRVNIMAERLMDTPNAQYSADSWRKIFRWFLSAAHYEYQKDIKSHNGKLCRSNPVFFGEMKKQLSYYTKVELKRKYLFGKNKYFEDPVPGEPYVYVPLHLIPESTTFVQAPLYVNELNNIEMLSKSIPAGWKIYVKEHQTMLGERSFEFYKKVKKIPNVRLVRFNYYQDPKPWITNAKGVFTVTGTGAYEAALLGKRSVIFGEMACQVIDGIEKVNSFRDLSRAIRRFEEPLDNIHSCAAYIHTAQKFGIPLKINYLMMQGKEILRNNLQVDDEYNSQLNQLIDFYEKGYNLYLDRENFKHEGA